MRSAGTALAVVGAAKEAVDAYVEAQQAFSRAKNVRDLVDATKLGTKGPRGTVRR